MKKVAVFASGSGSNFQSIIDANIERNFCKIELLVASKENIFAITRAKAAGIDYFVANKSNYLDLNAMFNDIANILQAHQIDYIVLAGYLTVLPQSFITKYENRIINVHPSLLPAFGGDGCYGIKVHQMALDYGVKVSGATVHFVNNQIDGGAIILQECVEIESNETAQTLQNKVLKIEHKILPLALELLTTSSIKVLGRKVTIKERK